MMRTGTPTSRQRSPSRPTTPTTQPTPNTPTQPTTQHEAPPSTPRRRRRRPAGTRLSTPRRARAPTTRAARPRRRARAGRRRHERVTARRATRAIARGRRRRPRVHRRILAKTEPTAARARLALVPTAETIHAAAGHRSRGRRCSASSAPSSSTCIRSAIRVFGGPPLLPWGSTVTVRSSSVTIDCGDGYEVPADWYVPEGPTPTGLIYLQHGFLAAGPFYSYTASRLAEATHSIVVTTTLTSNFLACDGCWVGGSPMHKAVADLFLDGNTALADSASAAGYSATLLNGVEKVVLIGHSAGGGLAAGAAGYMTENGTIDRLAGVVMLDGVGFGTVVPDGAGQAPRRRADLQPVRKVLFLEPERLLEHRPREGAAAVSSTGCGWSADCTPTRWRAATSSCRRGCTWSPGFPSPRTSRPPRSSARPGSTTCSPVRHRPTARCPSRRTTARPGNCSRSTPRAARPRRTCHRAPQERLTLLDRVFTFFSNILFGIDFATCVAPSAENLHISAPDTLLSLDGRTKPGQSIAQHVCTG